MTEIHAILVPLIATSFSQEHRLHSFPEICLAQSKLSALCGDAAAINGDHDRQIGAVRQGQRRENTTHVIAVLVLGQRDTQMVLPSKVIPQETFPSEKFPGLSRRSRGV